MPACLKRIQPIPKVPLAYVSVYQRMRENFHTLAYASTIRNSVTGPLIALYLCRLSLLIFQILFVLALLLFDCWSYF